MSTDAQKEWRAAASSQSSEMLEAGGEVNVGRQVVVAAAFCVPPGLEEQGPPTVEVEGMEVNLSQQADRLARPPVVGTDFVDQLLENRRVDARTDRLWSDRDPGSGNEEGRGRPASSSPAARASAMASSNRRSVPGRSWSRK